MTRPITAHLRDTAAFDPTRISGPSCAIYDTLADGNWHTRDDVLTATAKAVPAALGYRTTVKDGMRTPTGAAYTQAIMRGQRTFAGNRLLIQVRSRRVIQHPDNANLYRLADGLADLWRTHQNTQTAHDAQGTRS